MEQEARWRSADTDDGAVIGWWAVIQGCWTVLGDDGVWVVIGGGLCLTGRASGELEGAERIEAARAEATKRAQLLARDLGQREQVPAVTAPAPAVRRAPQGATALEEAAPARTVVPGEDELERETLKRRQSATLEWLERLCDECDPDPLDAHDRAQLHKAVCKKHNVAQLADVPPLALIKVCEWLDAMAPEKRAARVRLHVAAKALPDHYKRHLVMCRWCSASVLKTTTAASGSTMFVDPYPDPDNRGNVTLEEDDKGRLISTVWGSAKLAAHHCHHYTCPEKDKKKGRTQDGTA